MSASIVVAIFAGVLPRIAAYSDVWLTIKEMSSLETSVLLLIGLLNLAAYWPVQTAVLPGLTTAQAAVSNQASTAVANAVPAGGAIGVGVTYAMYSSWGFSGADVTRSILISGIWNTFTKLGLPVVALGLLAVTEEAGSSLVAGSLIGMGVLAASIALFAVGLKSGRLAERMGDLVGRAVSWSRGLVGFPPVTTWGAATSRFRTTTIDLLSTRWKRLTIATLVSHLSLYLVLLAALRFAGIAESEVGWSRVLAAFAFVRLISALPITPGGLGVVELGYAATLGIGLEEPARAGIVAAVLVFRFITYFLPIPIGTASYLFWRRNQKWRVPGDPPADAEPPEGPGR